MPKGNPNPCPEHRIKKGQVLNPKGRGKLPPEERAARAELKKLLAKKADLPVKRMYKMLEVHDEAVAKGLQGARNGVLNPDQQMKILTYLNDWGNGKAVETMRTVPPQDEVSSPLDMSDEERAAKISELRAMIDEEVPKGAIVN